MVAAADEIDGIGPEPTERFAPEAVAAIVHEAHRNAGRALGHRPLLAPWMAMDERYKDGMIALVLDIRLNPERTPRQNHDAWCAEGRKRGFTWGETFDLEAKTHPSLVPYQQLPRAMRIREKLTHAIVGVLGPEIGTDVVLPDIDRVMEAVDLGLDGAHEETAVEDVLMQAADLGEGFREAEPGDAPDEVAG